jgi:hypothetical protein
VLLGPSTGGNWYLVSKVSDTDLGLETVATNLFQIGIQEPKESA